MLTGKQLLVLGCYTMSTGSYLVLTTGRA